jgi:dihydrolipoamide dehydrogenase
MSTKTLQTDVVVVGAGTAGINAVKELEAAGCRWLLIEGGPLGTTCARVGCMPSKLLIAAADCALTVSEADVFGIQVARWAVDAGAVFNRVREHRNRFVAGVKSDLESLPQDRLIRGQARFASADSMVIACDQGEPLTLQASAFVIACGARPVIPEVFDGISDSIWLSDQIFELEELPSSLAVIGTGAIGLELGQALQRLGVAVTFFSNENNIGPLRDPELQKCVRDTLMRQHKFYLDVEIVAARVDGSENIVLQWQDANGKGQQQSFSRVLVAAGRTPQIEQLELARSGLELNSRGLPKDWDAETCQCGTSPIFMAGDVSSHLQVLHEASDEGRIAGGNAARYPDIRTQHRRIPLTIVFSDPQMAQVGASAESFDPVEFASSTASFVDQGRARIINRNHGMLKLYARRDCAELVGAELFGPEAEHLAHLLALAVHMKLTVPELLKAPFYHPVIEEALRTALRRLARQLEVEQQCEPADFATSPGT